VIYLEYQGIININGHKLQTISEDILSSPADVDVDLQRLSTVLLPTTDLAIRLTGSVEMGFTIGLYEGIDPTVDNFVHG